jgi:urease accessory protein
VINTHSSQISIFSAQIVHQRLNDSPDVTYKISLTSDERRKSIISFMNEDIEIRLQLFGSEARGKVLQDGDILLIEETGKTVQIFAKPEPVMTAITSDITLLLRSAYHLGNRHVPVEITIDWLRFQPDPVLKDMLEKMGLAVSEENVPFHPEAGAYHSH